MFYILATYQYMSITAINLTARLMFNSINQEIVKDILYDIEEEEKGITVS